MRELSAEAEAGFGYERDLDLEQAFNFRFDRQEPVGFLLSLTMGTARIEQELGMIDPSLADTGSVSATAARAPMAAVRAVGPLSSIAWELGDTDPIEFCARISPLAKQQLMGVQYAQRSVVDVTVAWATYEYDPLAHKYYVAFASSSGGAAGGSPAKGQLVKERGKLALKVSAKPSVDELGAPPTFELSFSIVPKDNLTQTLYLATGSTLRLNKPWGRTKAQ